MAPEISRLADVSPRARLGDGVRIGAYTVVHDNVVLGEGCVIEEHCSVGVPAAGAQGRPLEIGPAGHVRSHSVLYEGSTIGAHLITGHFVLVRERTVAGEHLMLGTRAEVQGYCEIGRYVKTHSDVHIAKGCRIGHLVWLFPRVQFTNDPFPPSNLLEGPTVGDLAVLATGAMILPGVAIGLGSVVAAQSVVRQDVPEVMCVAGDPARVICRIDQVRSPRHELAYPWPDHFRAVYPPESHPFIDEVTARVRAAIERAKAVVRAGARDGSH